MDFFSCVESPVPQKATLAPIHLTNAAVQLPNGSGETKGEASQPYFTQLPPLLVATKDDATCDHPAR